MGGEEEKKLKKRKKSTHKSLQPNWLLVILIKWVKKTRNYTLNSCFHDSSKTTKCSHLKCDQLMLFIATQGEVITKVGCDKLFLILLLLL